MEVELKLGLLPEHLDHLRRHTLWRRWNSERPVRTQLQSTYFDTPDHQLAALGITVRLRKDGRQYRQTVKTSGQRSAGLFSRQEWEWPVGGHAIDFVLLAETTLPAFHHPDLLNDLIPIFTTHVQRTTRRIFGEGWSIELAMDRGEIRSHDQKCCELCEIELELQEGSTQNLFQLAQDIVSVVPARLRSQSKSDLGFDLSRGTLPTPRKSRPVALDQSLTTGQAFQAIGRNCLSHLLDNERSLLEQHAPEAIHQMRVALRRFRSALKVFKPLAKDSSLHDLRQDMRWLLSCLGPARDADVFLAEMLAPVVNGHDNHPALLALRDHWMEKRHRDFALAVQAIQDRRFTQFALKIGAWLDRAEWNDSAVSISQQPIMPYAVRRLRKGHRKLLRAGGKSLIALTADHRHQVRILGKQMRYAGEFFAPLFPDGLCRDFLAALSRLQDGLGGLNDIEVARHRLAQVREQPDLSWAAGMVAGWHEAEEKDLLADAEKGWKAFRRLSPFWG